MKNCLIIAIPRSGSSNLLSSISSAYNLKSVFEPFTNHTNIHSFYAKKSVCKVIAYRLPYKKLIEFSRLFEKIILLSRKDTVAAAESFVAMRHDNNSNSKLVWNEVSKDNSIRIPYYIKEVTNWKSIISKLSIDLNLPIDYYEDVYSYKKLSDSSINLDLKYLEENRKLRGNKGIYII